MDPAEHIPAGGAQPDPPAPDQPMPDRRRRAGDEPDVRFTYANERTFLAWNRTALALMTAGLAVTQLLPPFDVAGGRRMIGLPLIAMGIVVALASLWQWRRNDDAMRANQPLPRSVLPALLSIVVSISAIVAFVLAVVHDE